jgi:predicted  nucleic acid-binding Zn-ribbon protein
MANRLQIKALRMLFKASQTVTCDTCGWQLKPSNKRLRYEKLAACGCPGCGGRKYTYDFTDDEQANRILAILGQGTAAHVH